MSTLQTKSDTSSSSTYKYLTFAILGAALAGTFWWLNKKNQEKGGVVGKTKILGHDISLDEWYTLDSSIPRIHILYGTTTNTTKQFSMTFSKKLEANFNILIKVSNIKDYNIEKLNNEDLVFIVSSTYENGTVPPSSALFFNDLHDKAWDFRVGKETLIGVRYAIFAIGEKDYADNYCKPYAEIHEDLERLSATSLLPLTLGDSQNPLITKDFNKWTTDLVSLISKEYSELKLNKKDKTAPVTSSTTTSSSTKSSCCGSSSSNSGSCCQTNNEDELEIEDKINNAFIEYEEKDESALLDLEDIAAATSTATADSSKDERREMVTSLQRKALTKEGYKLIGTHSAVKLCRWTKNQLRGRGGCYKHSFYGITSYQCMEATPSLACANKCVFCWRHHKNPIGTEWRWKEDSPVEIVDEAIRLHVSMINEMKGVPGVLPERLTEARQVRHCALSLVGEPIMYPKINTLLKELHVKGISSFLVTNGQFPDHIRDLEPVTQLYVSVDAANKESLKKIDRPLFKDYWERFLSSLSELKKKQQRTVYRLTLVKEYNMAEEIEGYVSLIELGQPDFIEIKSVTYCGKSDASNLTMSSVPYHEEVCKYGEEICKRLRERNMIEDKNITYAIATEHEHSCCILIAREDKFKRNNEWHTWINYNKFEELIKNYYNTGATFKSEDYHEKTPSWCVYKSKERGFDPVENRFKRNKKSGKLEEIDYTPTDSGCG